VKVGIIGGGMMGLATAHFLAKSGIQVTILEKDKQIGGLSRSEKIMPGLTCDRFYHVILTMDGDLLEFLDEIGLSQDVQFRETKTGFYTDGQLHSMSNTLEFLRFKPLSFWNKLRLGAGILYASKINNNASLQNIYAKTWLIRVFGQENFEKIWEPLLKSKLGSAKDQASGSFIWACINRYYGTRHESAKKEMMGCVRGGYDSILNHLQDNLLKNSVTILTDYEVEAIEPTENGCVRVACNSGESFNFDRAVVTVPNPQIIPMCPRMPDHFKKLLEKISYMSLVCVTLVLKKSLSPFYITNITDPDLPFTGLIEMSHVIPTEIADDSALIYLPKYLASDDSLFHKSDKRILDAFLQGLSRMFPEFSIEDVVAQSVNREVYVQPIQETGYADMIPPMKTPLENIYLVNTSMIVNSTLNNNQVIQLARKMSDFLLHEN